MNSLKFLIDDVEVEFEEGDTILAAAHKNGIYIPSLCYHPSLPASAGMNRMMSFSEVQPR